MKIWFSQKFCASSFLCDNNFNQTNIAFSSLYSLFPVKAEVQLISSRKVAVLCACFLYLAALATFGTLVTFYMQPAQYELKSLIQTSWDGGTLVCRPLQKMTVHGLSTQWNYDECMQNVRKANATTVVET